MTPEDTPRMAERTDRQAQIDPWDSVHEEFADMSQWETARVYRADAVDAARSADAALLRERDAQIASLTAQVKVLEQVRDIAQAGLDTLRAERDAAQQELAAKVVMLDQRLGVAALAFKRRAEAAEQERDRAQAGLHAQCQHNKRLREKNAAHHKRNAVLQQENQTLREALEYIARGGPKDGQRVGPMKMYQAMEVALKALSSSPRPQEPQP